MSLLGGTNYSRIHKLQSFVEDMLWAISILPARISFIKLEINNIPSVCNTGNLSLISFNEKQQKGLVVNQ